jgi:hypothetical protein
MSRGPCRLDSLRPSGAQGLCAPLRNRVDSKLQNEAQTSAIATDQRPSGTHGRPAQPRPGQVRVLRGCAPRQPAAIETP